MVALVGALDGKIELVSNGTLLSADNVAALLDCDLAQMTFSFDGITAATYEHIRRRAKHKQTLDAILDFRRRFAERDTLFAINCTMMRRNLPEVMDVVAFWDAADFDLIRFITMVIRENDPELIRESLYPVRESFRAALEDAARDVIARRRRITLRSPW